MTPADRDPVTGAAWTNIEATAAVPGSPDDRYRLLAARAGLYGHAFYGWRTTPAQRATLRRLWRRARRESPSA